MKFLTMQISPACYYFIISSLLGPIILLSTLFSDTLNLRTTLHVRYKASRSYEITGKIIVFMI
jgi:hypothetical protein